LWEAQYTLFPIENRIGPVDEALTALECFRDVPTHGSNWLKGSIESCTISGPELFLEIGSVLSRDTATLEASPVRSLSTGCLDSGQRGK
jgi:hypothetical protein